MAKIDWDKLYKEPMQRETKVGPMGRTSYGSGKELLLKQFKAELQTENMKKNINDNMHVAENLLVIRMLEKTPIKILKSITYQTQVLQKSEYFAGNYVDSQAVIYSGSVLIFKSLDPNLQQLIFEDQNGKEIELNYIDKEQLILHSDISQVVSKLNKE